MTAQINDRVFHRQIQFDLAGIAGQGLFDPSWLPFTPESLSTACWRGYVAHYTVEENRLWLTSLEVGLPLKESLLAKAGRGPELFEVLPQSDKGDGCRYEGFKHPVSFIGGLLLADGFIRELYVHMGFHPAWKYERVREIICQDGHVVEDFDRSAQTVELRAKMVESSKDVDRSRRRTKEEIGAWIEQCFSRNYKTTI